MEVKTMDEKRSIKVVIDKQGAFTVQAMEGYAGQSCVEKTKNVELLLGGDATEVAAGKTDKYYEGDGESPVSVSLGQ
jgi:hypothetical protein